MAKRKGFAQVEPNHLSGIVTGSIYAQLPVDTTTMGEIIENGRFAKYDYANGKVDLSGAGEWMLIYNEEKLYDERFKSHKDFAMIASNYSDKVIVPRLIKTFVGDIYTTNAFLTTDGDTVTSNTAEITIPDLAVGNKLVIGNKGYLEKAGENPTGIIFQVVKVYTMPDGQIGVKIQRIA
jgi:hypothetical protein